MHVAKEQVPVKMTAPGAVARQLPCFGNAADYTGISGEYFSLDADHMARKLAAANS